MAYLLACRVCLATDVKLYNMHSYNLHTVYENLTGISVTIPDRYPHYICTYCKCLLLKSNSFKETCIHTHQLLKSITNKLTQKHITSLYESQPPVHSLSTITIHDMAKLEIEESPVKEELPVHTDEKSSIKKIKYEKDILNFEFSDATLETVEPKVEASELVDTYNIGKTEYSEFEIETLQTVDIETFETMDFETDVIEPQNELETKEMDIIVLSKEQQVEEVLARKDSVNYQNSFYKCELCFKGFMTDGTFRNHMARHDVSAGPHICDVCNTRWPNKRSLKSHSATAHERKYICKMCNHVARSFHKAKEHIKWHKGHCYVCNICGASFSKPTSHLTHVRLQHPSEYCCEFCGDSFISQNGLNIHKKKAHSRDEESQFKLKYECTHCNTKFKNAEALTYHNDITEDGSCDPALSHCPQCGDYFESQEALRQHLKYHKEEPVRCDECDKTFSQERSLAVHYQRVHLGIKMKNKRKEGYKPVAMCEVCGKKCTSNSALIHHQRIHTGEKPFHCRECPKSFSVAQRLQIHMRTHTGERPFKCSVCPKAFKHKAALNRHNRVHTGVKPYQCSYCVKAFSQSNSMKLHVRTVHLKMPTPYRSRKVVKNDED